MKVMNHAGTPVSAYTYNLEPKTRFEAGKMKVDGTEVDVKVTGKGTKHPFYTYWKEGTQLYYVKGDYRGKELTNAKQEAPAQEAPAQEAAPATEAPTEPAPTEAAPTEPAPPVEEKKHGKKK